MSYTHLRMKGCTCFCCCETKKSTKPVFVSFVARFTNRKSPETGVNTNPNDVLLRSIEGKLLKITIHMHCLIMFVPSNMGNFIAPVEKQ